MSKKTILLPLVLLIPLFFVNASNAGLGDQAQTADLRFTDVDVMPEIVKQVQPEYPASARHAGIEGEVLVKILVSRKGEVRDVLIAESSDNYELDEAAITAAKGYKFKPAMKDNLTISVWVEQKVYFKLSDESDENPAKEEFVPVEEYPEMIYQEPPKYPEALKEAGIEGIVWLQVLVSKEGKVLEAQVAKSSGVEALDDSAIKAAYKNRYKPGIQKGRPVACWVTYKVTFTMHDRK